MTHQTRILVAEDDHVVRMVMVETLTDAGFDVLEAADGAAACAMVEDPDHVELIVTDLNMPGSDGLAVARCARERRIQIPVLFVTARPDLMGKLAFPTRCLPKPFSMRLLTDTVRDMLAARSG